MTKALMMSIEQDLKSARRSANAIKQARAEDQAKRERIAAIRICYSHTKDVPFALLLAALKKVGVEGLQEICKSNLNAFLVKKAIHRTLGIKEVQTAEADPSKEKDEAPVPISTPKRAHQTQTIPNKIPKKSKWQNR